MPTVLITGASRGLGLEFARQYAGEGWKVVATCRDPRSAGELKDLPGDLLVRQLDIAGTGQAEALAGELAALPIDVLLNNAGMHGPRDATSAFGHLDVAVWLEVLRVNAIAPVKVTEAFLPHVLAGGQKKIVFISSRAGSIAERGALPHQKPGGSSIYRSSKATLNAVVKGIGFDLRPAGVSVVVLHPGWVKTETGGWDAPGDAPSSVAAMRGIISRASPADNGLFHNHDGAIIPW
jgi:NAD(P)-dependent dehydrogenase (short-subunit alcohol dehydrogenase family)